MSDESTHLVALRDAKRRGWTLWQNIADSLPNYRLSKFQPMMPPWIEREMIADYLLDVGGAWRWITGTPAPELKRVPQAVKQAPTHDVATRHLVGPAARDCGLPDGQLLEPEVIERLIEGYTREAGVRELTRKITALFRGRALDLAQASASGATLEAAPNSKPIDLDELTRRLGPPRFRDRPRAAQLPVGVASGLSVGPFGGATMFVEVGCMPGRGELRLTGRLGEVLSESAQAVLAHLRLEPERYGLEARTLRGDWHVHLPEAATAKDGPSAGVALFAAMLSVLRQIPLPADVAMTGEATLMGDVLPVGGVRPKLLAAERAGMRMVLIPHDNLADVPDDVRVQVQPVSTLAEVARALGLRAGAAEPRSASAKDDAESTSASERIREQGGNDG